MSKSPVFHNYSFFTLNIIPISTILNQFKKSTKIESFCKLSAYSISFQDGILIFDDINTSETYIINKIIYEQIILLSNLEIFKHNNENAPPKQKPNILQIKTNSLGLE